MEKENSKDSDRLIGYTEQEFKTALHLSFIRGGLFALDGKQTFEEWYNEEYLEK